MLLKPLYIAVSWCIASASLYGAELCVKVVDYGDQPLPSASVAALDLARGTRYESKTDRKGESCFPAIREGRYSVEAGLAGFMNVRYYPVRVVFPTKTQLSFRLPLGEITEGDFFSEESVVSGTLELGGSPVKGARICIAVPGDPQCTTTNDLGEYAISVAPGSYEWEIRTADGMTYRSRINLPGPGTFRDRLTLREADRRPQ